jgi:hypothetical protein
MKATRTNLLAIVISISISPAFGYQWEREDSPRHKLEKQLDPWLKDIDRQLRQRPDFLELSERIGRHQPAYCVFSLGKNGEVKNPRYEAPGSQSTKVDQSRAIDIVRKLAPIRKPPNSLPYSKCIVVKFSQEQVEPKICLTEIDQGLGVCRW